MITKKHIENANYDHELTILGVDCKGTTIIVNGMDVLISVDKETNELVHHEVVNPKEIKSDWSMFTNI